MSRQDRIDLLYDKGRGSLRIGLDQADPAEWSVQISGSQSAFGFLAEGIAELLTSGDCHFSVSPWGPGCGWFGRTTEKDGDGYYLAGRDPLPTEGGLYVHSQSCESGLEVFPGGRGLAWLCFLRESSESGLPVLEDNPTFLFLEGSAEELRRFNQLLLRTAKGDAPVTVDQAALRHLFYQNANVGISVTLLLTD